MNYQLNQTAKHERKTSILSAIKRILPYVSGEGRNLIIALVAIFLTSASTLVAPIIIGHTINTYIQSKDYRGVLVFSGILLAVFAVGLFSSYIQTKRMGGVGRRVLFNLRNAIFNKLQELPVAFFNQNKAGDLISRINNDTDQLNQFFSQALMQFVGNFFLIVGAGIFLLVLNIRLGAAALLPALGVFVITQIISPWVKRKNLKGLQSIGSMSAEVQESINNFKVIVAFNRLDYFRQKFDGANQKNFKAQVGAGLANNIFTPIYGLASNLAQLIVISYGIFLIVDGRLTVGLLIAFLLYVNSFYNPLRQLASVWASLQTALAGIDRISEVLDLESDMKVIGNSSEGSSKAAGSNLLLEFKDVSFGYPGGKQVLRNVNLALEKGKTYALVGPTGGGKTTTASLMARLYDPTTGTILLDGKDVRSYQADERSKRIGFILQEPFLFTGNVRDNIIYGNPDYKEHSNEQLREVLEKANLSNLLARFEEGLDTPVTTSGDAISLGQKQLIAFIRAVLRRPEILILDEATANIDTVTEQLLEDILQKLPKETTKVIIAHRLNTIDSADQIYFVNGGEVTAAGSMEHAVELLLHGKRQS
jgi:ATP-binding cassette subfamily B protein